MSPFLSALPPPPALDEEAPANYFNLDPSSSPAIMNIALPPPPGINPPPPGKNSLISLTNADWILKILRDFFFPLGYGPPMFHPMPPPVPPPMTMRPPGTIHYPSQDPQRMGAHSAHSSRQTE